MQTLQQTLVEERDKILQNANQQRSMLEESLHGTKSEEQRLRTKLAEAEEVGLLVFCFCSGESRQHQQPTVSFCQIYKERKNSTKTIDLIRQRHYSEL